MTIQEEKHVSLPLSLSDVERKKSASALLLIRMMIRMRDALYIYWLNFLTTLQKNLFQCINTYWIVTVFMMRLTHLLCNVFNHFGDKIKWFFKTTTLNTPNSTRWKKTTLLLAPRVGQIRRTLSHYSHTLTLYIAVCLCVRCHSNRFCLAHSPVKSIWWSAININIITQQTHTFTHTFKLSRRRKWNGNILLYSTIPINTSINIWRFGIGVARAALEYNNNNDDNDDRDDNNSGVRMCG